MPQFRTLHTAHSSNISNCGVIHIPAKRSWILRNGCIRLVLKAESLPHNRQSDLLPPLVQLSLPGFGGVVLSAHGFPKNKWKSGQGEARSTAAIHPGSRSAFASAIQ